MIDALAAGVRQVLGEQKEAMRALVRELDAGALNWTPLAAEETNSIAQLLSHAMEAERFLLATAVDQPIERNREAQFQVAVPGPADVLARIDHTQQAGERFLALLTAEHLAREMTRGERTRPGSWWLLHAIEHANEHLGQALLTRQLYDARG